MQGVEVELEGRATQALTLNASVGYLHYRNLSLGGAAYDSVKNPSGPTLDAVPALTPKWKGDVGVQYGFNLGGLGALTSRVDYTVSVEFLRLSPARKTSRNEPSTFALRMREEAPKPLFF